MSINSGSNSVCNVKGKIVLFVHLGDLQGHVHFGVVDSLAIPLIFGTSFIDRFDRVIIPVERRIIPT